MAIAYEVKSFKERSPEVVVDEGGGDYTTTLNYVMYCGVVGENYGMVTQDEVDIVITGDYTLSVKLSTVADDIATACTALYPDLV